MPESAKPRSRGAFFRLSRMLHTYLSAFAFLALIFFSITGIVLNHPEWTLHQPRSADTALVLPADMLTQAREATQPLPALAMAIAARAAVVGNYKSGEIIEDEAQIRLESPKGATDIFVNLKSGEAEVTVQRAGALSIMNDLHRGKNAGVAWRGFIDVSAALLLALSVIGYVLFFSLRFRLTTSLVLTAASLGAMGALYLFFIP